MAKSEHEGLLRCLGCPDCICMEVGHGENRQRVGEVIDEQGLTSYFAVTTSVLECLKNPDSPIRPQGNDRDISDGSPAHTLYLQALFELSQRNPREEQDRASHVGRESERHIYSILSNAELCPWIVDVARVQPNSKEDTHGHDLTVQLVPELTKLLGLPADGTVQVQVKTRILTTNDFYKIAKAIVKDAPATTEGEKPNLHIAAKQWQEKRLVVLTTGEGERQESQIVFELIEQLKQHIAIQNPKWTVQKLEENWENIFIKKELGEKTSRFANGAHSKQDVYERDNSIVIRYLEAMLETAQEIKGEAWAKLVNHLANHGKVDPDHPIRLSGKQRKELNRQKQAAQTQARRERQKKDNDTSQKDGPSNGRQRRKGFQVGTARR